MFYVRLGSNGLPEKYPYTLADLRNDTPNTSFPQGIDDATAAAFGVFPVRPSVQPDETYDTNLSRRAEKQDGVWVEVWSIEPATAEQIAERTALVANDVRAERNARLASCDWTQLADSPAGDKTAWTQYRQALRDVPGQAGFPFSVTWPTAPG